jgi:hypothetical protein
MLRTIDRVVVTYDPYAHSRYLPFYLRLVSEHYNHIQHKVVLVYDGGSKKGCTRKCFALFYMAAATM